MDPLIRPTPRPARAVPADPVGGGYPAQLQEEARAASMEYRVARAAASSRPVWSASHARTADGVLCYVGNVGVAWGGLGITNTSSDSVYSIATAVTILQSCKQKCCCTRTFR